MFPFKCPACAAESKLFFSQHSYQGLFRCYRCRSLFQIRVEENRLVSAEPASEEDLKRQEEEQKRQKEIEELKNRFTRRPGD